MGEELPRRVTELAPDIVVLMTIMNDIATRQWTESEGPLRPSDPVFRERLSQSYSGLTDDLLDMGVSSVVWVIPLVPTIVWTGPEHYERHRYEVQHDVIREVVANAGEGASVIDLELWMTRTGHLEDNSWRPDGTHFSEASALQLVTEYFGPRLLLSVLPA